MYVFTYIDIFINKVNMYICIYVCTGISTYIHTDIYTDTCACQRFQTLKRCPMHLAHNMHGRGGACGDFGCVQVVAGGGGVGLRGGVCCVWLVGCGAVGCWCGMGGGGAGCSAGVVVVWVGGEVVWVIAVGEEAGEAR